MGYKFIYIGDVAQSNDGVLKDDMKIVAAASREVGTQAQQAVPGTLMGKLPLSFKKPSSYSNSSDFFNYSNK